MKKYFLRSILLLYVLLFVFQICVYAAIAGIGTISKDATEQLAYNAKLDYYESNAPKGLLKTYTLTGSKNDVEIIPYFGEYIKSTYTLSSMVNSAIKEGYQVVGAINGDFYDTKTGIPRGLMVQNGKLICSSSDDGFQDQNWRVMGITRSGSILEESVRIKGSLTLKGVTYEVNNFNRPRISSGMYLYDENYAASTGQSEAGLDVILTVKSGDFLINGTTSAVVDSVIENADNTQIQKGKMIISIKNNAANVDVINVLKGLKAGESVSYTPRFSNSAWNNVYQAMGSPDYLVKFNERLPGGGLWMNYQETYPSTAIGFKNDGTTVFFQADGRGSGGSAGIHPRYVAEFFQSIGCQNAMMLDGGGSSEIIAVKNGSVNVLNVPSDGGERRVGNCFLMVKRKSEISGGDSNTDNSSSALGNTSSSNNGTGQSKPNTSSSPSSDNSSKENAGSSGTSGKSPSGKIEKLNYPEDNLFKKRYLNKIKGLDKGCLIERFDNEEFLYSILFNGKKMKISNVDTNIEISFVDDPSKYKTYNKEFVDGIVLEFSQKDVFPGEIEIKYNVKNYSFKGKELNIYQYDLKNDSFTQIAEKISVKDSVIDFQISESNPIYITENIITNAESEASQKMPNVLFVISCCGIVVIGVVTGVLWLLHKKKTL